MKLSNREQIAGSVYQRRLRRLEVAMKSSLICLVYNKTLSISPNAANAGRAMTVMSTDVDIVSDTGDLFHEAWGQSLELIFGLIILANQVGWIWPVPIVIIGCKMSLVNCILRKLTGTSLLPNQQIRRDEHPSPPEKLECSYPAKDRSAQCHFGLHEERKGSWTHRNLEEIRF